MTIRAGQEIESCGACNRWVRIKQMKGPAMKPVIRYRSQLLFRKSYKPNRVIRIRPAPKVALVVRPARADPQNQTETQSRTMANVAFLD